MFDILHKNDDAFMLIEPHHQDLIFALTQSVLAKVGLKWYIDEDTNELIIEGTYGELNEFICTELDTGEYSEEEIEEFSGCIGFC